jgi:hypothetical protein
VIDPQKHRTHALAVLQALKAEETRRRADLAGVAPGDPARAITTLVAAMSRLEAPADVVSATKDDLAALAALCAAARVVKAGLPQIVDLIAFGAQMADGEKTRVVRPCPPAVVASVLGFGPRDPKFLGSAKRR